MPDKMAGLHGSQDRDSATAWLELPDDISGASVTPPAGAMR
jgi:hypothetical protein